MLAPVSTSFCYLTRIQGGFFGWREVVQIASEHIGNEDYWVLRTQRSGSSGYVGASARCMARNQL